MEEDPKEEIEWDIEDLKQAIIRSAEEYTKLMHGNLEPEESVLPSEPKWDIEDIKKAFIDNAKDYDKIMKQQKEEENE